jgi:hypothetical protein
MNQAHNKSRSDNEFIPANAHCDVLFHTKDSLCHPPADSKECSLPDATIKAMKELGEILRGIHNRLISEGYTISNGIITKPDANTKNTSQ